MTSSTGISWRKAWRYPVGCCLIFLPIAGCGGTDNQLPAVAPVAPVRFVRPPLTPRSFIYQLQNADPAELAAANADLYIIDPTRDGSDSTAYTKSDLATIRSGRPGVRILAYLSIGEAENCRGYWRQEWDANHDGRPDSAAPEWLGPVNPDWPGNYRVRYWTAWRWEKITTVVPRIIKTGFDGVYLDGVDAYEYWGPDGVGELTAERAQRFMIELIADIRVCSNVFVNQPTMPLGRPLDTGVFYIVPQNGEALGADTRYLSLIDGIGREDVWFNGDRANPPAEVAQTLAGLRRFRAAGKCVLTIDYVTRASLRRKYFAAAQAAGFLMLAPRRALDRCPTAEMGSLFPGP